MEIRLASGSVIGDGQPPYVIAEVGSNFRDLNDCIHSVVQAKKCGASAVKFQLYDGKSLYGREVDGLKGLLDPSWLPVLKEKADAVGIDFLCTAFSPELYELVNEFVPAHKIASSECTHKRILERVRKLGKPVILSTGASGVEDMKAALSVLKDTPTVVLYCVADYPARIVQPALISVMRTQFGRLVGFSDHTTDVLVVPNAAINFGACVIEKHATFIDAQTPDSPHSLTASEFKLMMRSIRGEPTRAVGFTPEEMPMLKRHNRRLIATKNLCVGDRLTEGENFGIYRSLKDDAHAFHPFMIDEVNGKVLLKPIKAGDGIGPGDV